MRHSDIKTIKNAHQTVHFFNIIQNKKAAIFLQLPSNTQEHFLQLSQTLRKMDFFLFTSLVKDHHTPNIFKSTILITSLKSRSWKDFDLCIKAVKILYPNAIFFFIKDMNQIVPIDQIENLRKFEIQSYLTVNVNTLLTPFIQSFLIGINPFTTDFLNWLDSKNKISS